MTHVVFNFNKIGVLQNDGTHNLSRDDVQPLCKSYGSKLPTWLLKVSCVKPLVRTVL